MLFHVREAKTRKGVYWVQGLYEFDGVLNVDAMQRAWAEVVARHTVLRTGFVWEGVPEPVQVVMGDVQVPFEVHDWTAVADQKAALDELLARDRAQGFDLTKPPLMRVHVINDGTSHHRMVWALYAGLCDGWSVPVVLEEVGATYDAFCRGTTSDLEPVRPYRDFIAWLGKRDRAEAEAFWRDYLAGFDTPTALPVDRSVSEHWARGRHRVELPEDLTTSIMELARRRRVTPSTVIQAAWALLLSIHSGDDEVVYGLTVSGRPAGLPGVESMVGAFINTLPVRVRVSWELSFADWLNELQANQVAVQRYEFTALSDIESWSGLPRRGVFDTIVEVDNYPQALLAEVDESGNEDRFGAVDSIEQFNYPIAFAVDIEDTLKFEAEFSTGAFDDTTIAALLDQLKLILTTVAGAPATPVREIALLGAGRPDVRHDAGRLEREPTAGAAEADLGLETVDLVPQSTVAELADEAAVPLMVDEGPATGPVPLTPIQRWFTNATIDERNHWNWSGLFELEPDVDVDRLAAALTTLVTHHDALCTRLHHGPDGWHQHIVEPGEAARFEVVQGDAQQHMDVLQRSLDLENGPLVAAVLVDRGDEPAWLGLVVHHLVVDGVSWNVLLEDLDAAYRGEELPPRTTLFRRWAESVTTFADSDEVRAELPYWLEKVETPFTLPVDATGANTEDSVALVEVAVDVGVLPNAKVLDVVLAALHQALGEWAGTETVVVDLEHHGRESVAPGTDLSRTVGWFTSVHPLVLRHDDLTDGAGVVAAARESLKSVPRHGVGYGALRHLTADSQEVRRLRAAPERQISVNFSSRFDTASDVEPALIVDELPVGLCGESTSGGVRPYALHLEIERPGGGELLLIEWHHSTNLHHIETVRRVASRFRQALTVLSTT